MIKHALKMRRKVVLPIVVAASAAMSMGLLVACGEEGYSVDDIINMGYIHTVDYYYDGGIVNEKDATQIQVKEDSYIPEPGASYSNIDIPVKSGYSLRDFCYAKTDDEGNLELDDNGKPIADENNIFSFSTVKADKNITIVARWWENYTVVLHYGDNYSLSTSVKLPRNRDGSPTTLSTTFYNVSDYTFLDYYYDKNETVAAPVTGEFTSEQFEASDDKITLDIYGKSLNGTYRLIREANDFAGFYMGPATNLYLLDDIDMTDYYTEDRIFIFPANYSGTIIGNNKTITGLQAEFTPSGATDTDFGLFKSISNEANISDITFKDVTVKLNLSSPIVSEYNVGLLAGRVRDGATLSNVKISGSLEYEVIAGYDLQKVHFGELIGDRSTTANITDTEVISATLTTSQLVYTADNAYAVYVKVMQTSSGTSIVDVYGLATGDLSVIRYDGEIEKVTAERYILKSGNDTYSITVSLDGNDELTATVVKS